MERRVKERMVGAAILVAVVVLVVPEFLSGPARSPSGAKSALLPASAPAEPMRTVRVDVNGNAETAAPAIEGDAAASAVGGAPPAGTLPPAAAPPAGNAPAKAPPAEPAAARAGRDAPPANMPAAEAPTAKPPATKMPPGKRGAWAVQLGSFESKANAEKLMKHWKSKGYPVYVSSVGSGSSARHRVRIGPYADRAAALAAVARLKASRQTASIVSPGH